MVQQPRYEVVTPRIVQMSRATGQEHNRMVQPKMNNGTEQQHRYGMVQLNMNRATEHSRMEWCCQEWIEQLHNGMEQQQSLYRIKWCGNPDMEWCNEERIAQQSKNTMEWISNRAWRKWNTVW